MNIRKWHKGKIVILWAWGAVIVLLLLEALRKHRDFLTQYVFLGFAVLALLLVVPLALSVVTWKWLGAKECAEKETERR